MWDTQIGGKYGKAQENLSGRGWGSPLTEENANQDQDQDGGEGGEGDQHSVDPDLVNPVFPDPNNPNPAGDANMDTSNNANPN